MGNCQTVDAAALVIKHPNGRLERLYWPVTASEVMKMNPGHYVSLIIPLPSSGEEEIQDPKKVRFTRVKLLRPNETLVLGHSYRLITSQEVINFLRAKKYAKMKKQQPESSSIDEPEAEVIARDKETTSGGGQTSRECSDKDSTNQVTKRERHRPRRAPASSAVARTKPWRPILQSIAESGS